MELRTIEDDPEGALVLMERYVNNGSPSGFSFVNTTSPSTCPRSLTRSFALALMEAAPNVVVHQFGEIPPTLFELLPSALDSSILAHPDMAGHPILRQFYTQPPVKSHFLVTPTASGRTVRIAEPPLIGYLKLHYEGHLGRILRKITLKHAMAALETNDLLTALVHQGQLPNSFAFLPEPAARVLDSRRGDTPAYWGMIWRSADPVGSRAADIRYVLPAFSLFSQDIRQPQSRSLLQQLGYLHGTQKVSFLLEDLLLPLVEVYFAMLRKAGLQGEWHAQNVLFGFDSSWHCVASILRDLESVDRDLPLMALCGQSTELQSRPYKCFDYSDPNYTVRHSFMFDHKFGEYLLAPLIDHASEVWQLKAEYFDAAIAGAVRAHLRALPADFFPVDGSWYRFESRLIDQTVSERPYVRLAEPRFRLS